MPGRCSTGFLSAINIKDDEADNASNPAAPTPRGTNHGSLSHLDHELQPAQLVSPSRVRAWVQPSPLLLKPTTTSGGGGGRSGSLHARYHHPANIPRPSPAWRLANTNPKWNRESAQNKRGNNPKWTMYRGNKREATREAAVNYPTLAITGPHA